MKTKQPVYIYGPPGCGKSINAEALAKAYNCDVIVDGWVPGDEVPDRALVLTNSFVPEGISFYEAMGKVQGLNMEWLEEQEFYEEMQAYRHAPFTDQPAVVAAFEAVKQIIRDKSVINKVQGSNNETIPHT